MIGQHYKNFSFEPIVEVIDGVTHIEEWKPIVGMEGIYEASTMGRIRGVDRVIVSNVKGFKRSKTYRTAIKAQTPLKNGYLTVGIVLDKHKHSKFVQRLIATTFIPNTKNKEEVNHKNGIRTDNRVSNLEWNTRSENTLHSFRELNRKPPRGMLGKKGVLHHRSKAVICLTDGREFGSALEAAREFKLTSRMVYLQCKNNVNPRKTKILFKYK